MTETTHYEWTVRVHCAMGVDRDIPGPHDLDCSNQALAEARYGWWKRNRPDARPELLRREVVTTRGPWTIPDLPDVVPQETERNVT